MNDDINYNDSEFYFADPQELYHIENDFHEECVSQIPEENDKDYKVDEYLLHDRFDDIPQEYWDD